MPYKYQPIKLERGGIGLIPTSIFGEQEGGIEPWGGRMSIFDEPVPEDSGPAPRRYRRNPMGAPDMFGGVWAMGLDGPYRAYDSRGMTNDAMAKANAKVGARGDYFIDPPKGVPRIGSIYDLHGIRTEGEYKSTLRKMKQMAKKRR